MRIGISTGCLYPGLTEQNLDSLLKLGFQRFEIFFSAPSELEPSYLDILKKHLEKYHASVSSIHPFTSSYESFLFFSNYQRRFWDGIRLYENYFRAAARLGADKVILHGAHQEFGKAISEEEYCRRFALLSDRAAEYHIKLLQENVFLHKSGSLDFIQKMKDLIPQAKFTCDTKQAFRCGYDPSEMALLMGERLEHIHISDFNTNKNCLLPGRGCMDYPKFFHTLQEINYHGDMIIEVYRNSFQDLSELTEAANFLRKYETGGNIL